MALRLSCHYNHNHDAATLVSTFHARSVPSSSSSAAPLHVSVFEASSDAHLRAACNLRVRSFHTFRQTCRLQEYRKLLEELEFEALKERIEGKRTGFGNVSCVVATIFVSDVLHFQDDQFSSCKIDGTRDGELRDQLVVGSLDLNQTAKLPDEICGAHPKGIEAHRNRGYLSNVCVAKELQRRGIGSTLIKHTKKLAQLRGISDLYTHVVAENESAKKLYEKNGFVVESEEKASEARLSGRPRRLLLWVHLEKPL